MGCSDSRHHYLHLKLYSLGCSQNQKLLGSGVPDGVRAEKTLQEPSLGLSVGSVARPSAPGGPTGRGVL